jgi:hypothetical protein
VQRLATFRRPSRLDLSGEWERLCSPDMITEIKLPARTPAWMADRAKLRNAVEVTEKRKDAHIAREIEFALPRELPRTAMWIEIARKMADRHVTLVRRRHRQRTAGAITRTPISC